MKKKPRKPKDRDYPLNVWFDKDDQCLWWGTSMIPHNAPASIKEVRDFADWLIRAADYVEHQNGL